jgi:hypothetical protein
MRSIIASNRGICILLLVLFGEASHGQAPAAEDSVARSIANELDALMSPDVSTIRDARIALVPQLQDFYSRRAFRTVTLTGWTRTIITPQHCAR